MQKITNCPVCRASSIRSFITTKAQMHSQNEKFNFDRCDECGFVFINPRVPLEYLKSYYTDYYLPYRGSKAWGKYSRIVEESQKRLDDKRLNVVKKWHGLNQNSLLLDIGCGKPSFLNTCQLDSKCDTLGIDFSDEGWIGSNGEFRNVNLQMSEIRDLDQDLNPDVITMWHYLEHDYFPEENLNHLSKLSKNSTQLIIEIPNFDSASRKEFGADWAGWHTPRHTSLFSPHNIELLLSKSGWSVQKVLHSGTMNPYLLYWMSKMEQKQIEWNKNLEDEFLNFMLGMLGFLPKKINLKKESLGIMTIVAKPK